jgi:GNAT superfamily N-acetyltransferase
VNNAAFTVRAAAESDAPAIAELVRELAVYEKLDHLAVATAEDFRLHLFGPSRAAEAIVAEAGGQAVGFALFFTTFSTFRGRPGVYLEDIYVRPAYRGRGIGKALIASLAEKVAVRGGGRLEWAVLNWNTPSIEFYRSLGARPLDEWTTYRLDGEPLARLASLARRGEGTPG